MRSIDYGAGNLTSVRKALAAVGAEVQTPQRPADLDTAAGRHRAGRRQLSARPRRSTASGATRILGVVERGRPLLGICVGLQWLFEGSTEAPGCEGLALMTGQCQLPRSAGMAATRCPTSAGTSSSFREPRGCSRASTKRSQVYFTHSYAAPVTDDAIAVTTHGRAVCERGRARAGLRRAVSSREVRRVGLRVLKNFLNAV